MQLHMNLFQPQGGGGRASVLELSAPGSRADTFSLFQHFFLLSPVGMIAESFSIPTPSSHYQWIELGLESNHIAIFVLDQRL